MVLRNLSSYFLLRPEEFMVHKTRRNLRSQGHDLTGEVGSRYQLLGEGRDFFFLLMMIMLVFLFFSFFFFRYLHQCFFACTRKNSWRWSSDSQHCVPVKGRSATILLILILKAYRAPWTKGFLKIYEQFGSLTISFSNTVLYPSPFRKWNWYSS